MSHITTVKTKLTDTNCVARAVEQCRQEGLLEFQSEIVVDADRVVVPTTPLMRFEREAAGTLRLEVDWYYLGKQDEGSQQKLTGRIAQLYAMYKFYDCAPAHGVKVLQERALPGGAISINYESQVELEVAR